jgi:hypothetical protein
LQCAVQFWVEATDAESGERGFQPVDDVRAVADQALTLARLTLGIFLVEGRDRGHAAMARLAAEPAQEGTFEQADIQPVGLRPKLECWLDE